MIKSSASSLSAAYTVHLTILESVSNSYLEESTNEHSVKKARLLDSDFVRIKVYMNRLLQTSLAFPIAEMYILPK